MTKHRALRGSKLNRSETVTVRLDPKLNYLTELAGRAQRRTKSSFMEWAVQEALKELNLGVCPTCGHPTSPDAEMISAARNRLRIHGRLIDYPGGEIGFERDAALAQSAVAESDAPND